MPENQPVRLPEDQPDRLPEDQPDHTPAVPTRATDEAPAALTRTTNPYGSVYRERFISPDANPRRPRRNSKPLRLHHFCRAAALPSIQRHGVNRGDVPVHKTADGLPSPDCFNNAVWLTEQADVRTQEWIAPSSLIRLMDKAQVRLTVELDASDWNLWCWRDLARHLGVESEWYQELNRNGGGFADKWWVYVNEPIPPERIVAVLRP